MDDRSIKGNSSGKYNMNFIDPTNDIPSYYDGMTELQEIVEKYFDEITYKKPEIGKLEKYDPQKGIDTCSVCLQQFENNEKIKILPCKHGFHDLCIIPWLQSNSKCPNCRYDLNS